MTEMPNEITLTKTEAATRQVEAAVDALMRGDFDIAITLAGAAEGMIDRDENYLFAFLRDSERVSDVPAREWITTLNMERDWLKHSCEPDVLTIEKEAAFIMVARAASKLEKWTPPIEAFKKIFKEVLLPNMRHR
jgi:hypothetical protein